MVSYTIIGALVASVDKWVVRPREPPCMQVFHEVFADFLSDLYLGAYLYGPGLYGVDAECLRGVGGHARGDGSAGGCKSIHSCVDDRKTLADRVNVPAGELELIEFRVGRGVNLL